MTQQINNCGMITASQQKSRILKTMTKIFTFCFAIGMGFLFTACGHKPPVVDNVNILVNNYLTNTKSFLDNEVLEDVVKFSTGTYDEVNLLDATYNLGDGEQPSLNTIKVIFTYKQGEDLLYRINQLTFNTNVSLSKIAEYDINKEELSQIVDNATISTEYEIDYTELESIQNETLAKAIFHDIVKSNEQNVRLIVKNTGRHEAVIDDVIYPFNKYSLTVQTDKGVKLYEVSIRAQDTVQDMIDSLIDSRNYILRNTKDIENMETTIEYKKYEKDTIEVAPEMEEIFE